MIWLRNARLRLAKDDSGFSLIEVLVAAVIFTLVSASILLGMLSVLKLTRDSRAIQVATNLASEQIDLARAVDDVFDLNTTTLPTRTINGDVFTIKRTAQWVTNPDVALECGAGGSALRYKAVTITVTWANMAPGSEVQSYTVINPSERINDPTKGTIIVSVKGANGAGMQGITVNATPGSPANGAVAIPIAPEQTDSDGCSYILKVTPGNYTVTASKSGYIDELQNATASKAVNVGVGTAVAVQFAYDKAISMPVKYATNYTATTPKIPTNMDTTFAGTYGNFNSAATSNSLTRTLSLFPVTSGYEVMAGKLLTANALADVGCLAPDPSEWPNQTILTQTFVGSRPPAVGGIPGASLSTVNVPMGVVMVTGTTSGSQRYLKAVSADGDPRCLGLNVVPATSPKTYQPAATYTFGEVLTTSPTTTTAIALPYGNWILYSGNSSTQTTVVSSLRMTIPTGLRGSVNALNNVLTLDPRVAQ